MGDPEPVAGPGGGGGGGEEVSSRHFPPAVINSSVLRDIRLFNMLLIVHEHCLET